MNIANFRFTVAALIALTLAACGDKAPPPAPPPPEVGVITAAESAAPVTRELVGRAVPVRSAEVRARIAGILKERVYKEGSDVKAGDVLFRIDPAPFNAALQSRRAALTQARANAANAQAKAKRVQELSGRGVVSRQDLDDAVAAAKTTQAEIAAAQAGVDQANLDLSYATVTAPIDGRAGKAAVTEGALVGQGDATLLTTIEQLDPIYIEFTQSVADLRQLQQAQKDGRLQLAESGDVRVDVRFSDGTPYPEPGLLGFTDLSVDPSTGAVALRATVPNTERQLLPGMYLQVRLTLGEQSDAFPLPQAAILRDAQGPYVLVVGADDVVVQKHVTLGAMQGDRWIVSSGVDAGDRVIVSGVQKARPRMPARAVPWTPAAPTDGAAPSGNPEQPATNAPQSAPTSSQPTAPKPATPPASGGQG